MTGRSLVPGRGRKPKPVQRKALAGNPGKRVLNQNEPDFTQITNAEPPDWFDEPARTMWRLVIAELCGQQVLRVTDLHNVELFCMAYRNWREAQLEVMQLGITMMTEQGRQKNPAISVANEAFRQIVTSGSLLGLDPSSRQRLIGAAKTQSNNPFKNL